MGENLNQEGTNMIQQGILPFKLERTSEEITPRSGQRTCALRSGTLCQNSRKF